MQWKNWCLVRVQANVLFAHGFTNWLTRIYRTPRAGVIPASKYVGNFEYYAISYPTPFSYKKKHAPHFEIWHQLTRVSSHSTDTIVHATKNMPVQLLADKIKLHKRLLCKFRNELSHVSSNPQDTSVFQNAYKHNQNCSRQAADNMRPPPPPPSIWNASKGRGGKASFGSFEKEVHHVYGHIWPTDLHRLFAYIFPCVHWLYAALTSQLKRAYNSLGEWIRVPLSRHLVGWLLYLSLSALWSSNLTLQCMHPRLRVQQPKPGRFEDVFDLSVASRTSRGPEHALSALACLPTLTHW